MHAGVGIGVESRKVPSYWQYGVVDNHCPECLKGSLDRSRSYTVGGGRGDGGGEVVGSGWAVGGQGEGGIQRFVGIGVAVICAGGPFVGTASFIHAERQ